MPTVIDHLDAASTAIADATAQLSIDTQATATITKSLTDRATTAEAALAKANDDAKVVALELVTTKTTLGLRETALSAANAEVKRLKDRYEPPIVVGPTYNVQPGNDTLLKALATAKTGDTLSMAPGVIVCTKTIVVPDGKALKFLGYGKATLDGQDKLGPILLDGKKASGCTFDGFTVRGTLSTNRPYEAAVVVYGTNNKLNNLRGTKNHGYCFGFNTKNGVILNVIATDTFGSGIGGQFDDSTLTDCGNVRTSQGSVYWPTVSGLGGMKVINGLGYPPAGYEQNKITSSNGLTVVRFIADGNNGHGLWFDETNTNIKVDGGQFTNNDGTVYGDKYLGVGLMFEISRGPIEVYGVGLCKGNSGSGIMFGNSMNWKVAGAWTFDGDGSSLVMRAEPTRYSPSAPQVAANRIWLRDGIIDTSKMTFLNGARIRWGGDGIAAPPKGEGSPQKYAAKYNIVGAA